MLRCLLGSTLPRRRNLHSSYLNLCRSAFAPMPPAKKRKTAASKAVAVEKPAKATTSEPEQQPEPKPEPKPEIPANESPAEEVAVTKVTTTTEETASDPKATKDAADDAQADDAKEEAVESSARDVAEVAAPAPVAPEPAAPEPDAVTKAADRLSRFRALQARAKSSSDQNLKAAAAEAQRQATDPSQLTALHRRHAIASHKILKADVEESGEDFERKRAWDWTIEESERWDKRIKKKEAARDNNAFQDYRQHSQKVYKRQIKNMVAASPSSSASGAAGGGGGGGTDLEKYTRDKLAAVEKAAAAGTLDIVETEDGELIAVDREGTFYSTADSTSFASNRPDKAAIDRLVNDMRKADEVAAKKRKAREARNGEDADVTYINDKNKQFNQKLARFYNKYTAEIRDSFERGTMI